MDAVRSVLKQLAAFWASLPTPKRLALVLVSVGVLAGVLALSYFGTRERYAYLYTDLDPRDAAGIVEKLKSLQVPHQLEGNGTAIKVPEEKVAELRLELAAAGLPRGGGAGFELFDRSQIGATEFEQHVNLRRALEGELVRSVLTVDGVESARVHLVVPERRLFASREESASASVVLKLVNSAAFGRKEVAAIVHLVAAAVPGLSRDRVSVVSTDGVTLHRPNTGNEAMDGDFGELGLERAQVLSSQMESDVRSQVERVVGQGNADVRVNVALDTASRERNEEHYEPSKTALRSEQKVEEMAAETAAGVAGVPGAVSNLPDAQQGEVAAETAVGPNGDVFRRSQTRNWEVDRVAEKTTMPAGSIRRLSVAVLLNGRYEMRGRKEVYVPRDPQELARLESLVKQAVGFDESRGDTLTVTNAQFARQPLADGGMPGVPPFWKRWLWHLVAGGAALALALVVLVRRSGRRRPVVVPRVQLKPVSVEHGRIGLPVAAAPSPRLPESQELDAAELRRRALQAASEDAASSALVLRGWLNGATGTPAGRP
ncbi:MAG: flagellar M-ring protein FliF [Polyangiaceae bacterium]|nr:flagellar M-ring protein FliF [Polyangiaceae bacterium]